MFGLEDPKTRLLRFMDEEHKRDEMIAILQPAIDCINKKGIEKRCKYDEVDNSGGEFYVTNAEMEVIKKYGELMFSRKDAPDYYLGMKLIVKEL